jgi:hypothetical protein
VLGVEVVIACAVGIVDEVRDVNGILFRCLVDILNGGNVFSTLYGIDIEMTGILRGGVAADFPGAVVATQDAALVVGEGP